WFGRAYLNRGPVALLTNAEGAILAFAALAPIPAAQTLAVGLLRYRPQVQADQLRSLLLAAAGWARQQGYAQLDLGLLQDVQDPAAGQRPFLARQLRRLRLRISPWLNQAALQAAQTAVATAWQPQYLAYPGPASLPAVWAALSQRVGDVPLS
ncbi:MAG: DUF2156 domain-containing protein, partial [Anaerolineales bacterium]|nr:DUF2156 domain-containing protein [Anaerolineales bacterium]